MLNFFIFHTVLSTFISDGVKLKLRWKKSKISGLSATQKFAVSSCATVTSAAPGTWPV
jgi:hypothetical protein